MRRNLRIYNLEELEGLELKLFNAADVARERLQTLCSNKAGIEVLYDLKFKPSGRDPLEDRDLNIIEQLNQQFTYLVTIHAVRQLMKRHPGMEPYKINLGTAAGFDIESDNHKIVAEVFSSADPKNNGKLENDVERVYKTNSEFKYVFYHSPQQSSSEERLLTNYPGVKIVYLERLS